MRPERFQVISVIDEALDTESMPLKTMIDYYEKRDIAMLAQYIKPGARPTIYHLRPVPHSLWQSFVMAGGAHEDIRFRRAFMCGVEKVENLQGGDGVGVPWAPTRRISDTTTVMSEEECDERFSPYEALEIGSVVFRHSFLPRRIKLTYPLPSLCVEALTHRPFQSAEPSPSAAPTTNSSQPSNATDPPAAVTVSI